MSIAAMRTIDFAVFDLKPDRYFSYDPEDPAASIESLKKYTENSNYEQLISIYKDVLSSNNEKF